MCGHYGVYFCLNRHRLWAINDSHGANQMELKKIHPKNMKIKREPKSNFLRLPSAVGRWILKRCFFPLVGNDFGEMMNSTNHDGFGMPSTVILRLKCTSTNAVAHASDRPSLITSFNDRFVSLSTCDVILTINLLPCHRILSCSAPFHSVAISELFRICMRCHFLAAATAAASVIVVLCCCVCCCCTIVRMLLW